MFFPVSGVEIAWYIPPLAALVLSFFTSMSGISGAFLLLPFQMEVLGYTSPSVSGTNQFYNIIAIPSGVYRYYKEGRFHKPLAIVLIFGAIPGVILGVIVRSFFFTDPLLFKQFASIILVYLAIRMILDARKKGNKGKPGDIRSFKIIESKGKVCRFTFDNKDYEYSQASVFFLSLLIAFVGGIYGIGGGAIIAPLLVSYYKLPIYITAGATLFCTCISSIAGVCSFFVLSMFFPENQLMPDFLLGTLFGLGGIIGMSLGAKAQAYVPYKAINLIIIFVLVITAFLWLKPLFLI